MMNEVQGIPNFKFLYLIVNSAAKEERRKKTPEFQYVLPALYLSETGTEEL